MIISTKYKYTQIFLKMLCPIEDYYQLLEDAVHYLNYSFEHESQADGVVEHEMDYNNTVIVIQYHPHLGIHLYLNDMEDALVKDEETLKEVATKMQELL